MTTLKDAIKNPDKLKQFIKERIELADMMQEIVDELWSY
jgi:hypothetical protein